MNKMNSDRIKKIHEDTVYPESVSVQQALFRVWSECSHETKQLEAENAALRAVISEILYDLLESNPIMSDYWRKKTLHLIIKEGGRG